MAKDTSTGKKDIHVLVHPELHKRVRLKCVEEDVLISDVVIRLLEEWTGFKSPQKAHPYASSDK